MNAFAVCLSHSTERVILHEVDRVLVKNVRSRGRWKLADCWELNTYIIMTQHHPDIPVYVVKSEKSVARKTRNLHHNLLYHFQVGRVAPRPTQDASDEVLPKIIFTQRRMTIWCINQTLREELEDLPLPTTVKVLVTLSSYETHWSILQIRPRMYNVGSWDYLANTLEMLGFGETDS